MRIDPSIPLQHHTTTSKMAPTTPLKRPSPSDSPQSDPEGPILKKRRIDPYLPQTPPAESVEDRSEDGYGKAHNTEESHDEALPSENMEMDITMKRSIAIALKHVGFESSSKEALESFFVLTQRCEGGICAFKTNWLTLCRCIRDDVRHHGLYHYLPTTDAHLSGLRIHL